MTSQDRRGDNSPSAHAEAKNEDRTGLLVAISALGASLLAVGIGVGAILISENQLTYVVTDKANRERDVDDKLVRSENHWRQLEVDVKALQSENAKLKEELSHADRRR